MAEIKAVIVLDDVHLAQAINYLEAYKMDIGLLINFASKRLEFKRVMKPGKSWNYDKDDEMKTVILKHDNHSYQTIIQIIVQDD